MLAKSSAALTYALFPRHPDGVKIVVNDFLVKKCSDFIDILRGEAIIDDSRVLVPVCCFSGSFNKVMADNQPMQKNIAFKRIRFDPMNDDMKREILSVPVVFL
jgi:hypothetical protein